MKCPVCNQDVNENEIFCMNCGNPLHGQSQNYVQDNSEQLGYQYQQNPNMNYNGPTLGQDSMPEFRRGKYVNKGHKAVNTCPRWVAILLGIISGILFCGIVTLGLFYINLNREYNLLVEYSRKDEVPQMVEDAQETVAQEESYWSTYTTPVVEPKEEPVVIAEPDEDVVLNVWSFTDEVPNMIQKYIDLHPGCGITMNPTIIATTDGAYQPALDQALMYGGESAPDIYSAESAFLLKYTQGDMYQYAMPYEDLGIDVASETKKADIAQYTIDLGTNPQGKLVGLGYQATGGAFIYRRSIAKAVWGTDDPDFIESKIGGKTGEWTYFFNAAAELRQRGYAIVSGNGDIWHAVENSSPNGWISNGKLYIDPHRENFLDLSRQLYDNDYCNYTIDWQDAWFNDMKGIGQKPVFGFFGPAWLINYTLAPNCGGERVGEGTYGDWAICNPPSGFFWGGTWLIANKDTKKKRAVRDIIRWITLDCSRDGLQYMWANGTFNGVGGTKDCVASGTVMRMSDGKLDFLGGQDMFDAFTESNQLARGNNLTQYDETINSYWRQAVNDYAYGYVSKNEALNSFKQNVRSNLGISY